LPADQVAYESVSGVAGGAINAALLSSFPVGQEAQAVARMQKFWIDAADTPLYENWFGGVVNGMFNKGGLYDSAPLQKFLKSQFKDVAPMSRSINVGIVDLLSGKWVDYTDETIKSDTIVDLMYTSLSSTPYFAPVEAFGSYYYDGSAIYDIDIASAVNKCLAKGYTHDEITVDIIMTSSSTLDFVDTTQFNSIEMGLRFLKIARYYGTMDGFLRAKFAYPTVNFRYAISPSSALPHNSNPLSLNSDDMLAMYKLGMNDALVAISKGVGASVNDAAHLYSLKKAGNKSMTFGEYESKKAAGEFSTYKMEEDKLFLSYQ